jgi:cytochrome c oxidase cbb3-type subunit 3
MKHHRLRYLGAIGAAVTAGLFLVWISAGVMAQQVQPDAPAVGPAGAAITPRTAADDAALTRMLDKLLAESQEGEAPDAGQLIGVPVTNLRPGTGSPPEDKSPTPPLNAERLQRGMQYFVSFNCVGCHAPNGGGGMGPSLSNSSFIYGGEPQNIFLSIKQGRPNGMPAWGQALPDSVIWDLVAYIRNLSREPKTAWGRTFSAEAVDEEQVPAEFLQAQDPWNQTEAFSHGQKPNQTR